MTSGYIYQQELGLNQKDCGKIRLAEESKTAERTKIKNA
jgi:hypothetical protein